MTDSRKKFWDTVNKLLHEHEYEQGYFEIVAHRRVYRSVGHDYGIKWVSWEPFRTVEHFSAFTDPDATITWNALLDHD